MTSQSSTLTPIRVLFYRPKWGDGHLLDNAIAGWTNLVNLGESVPQTSHTELWVPSDDNKFLDSNNKPLGLCYTSTMGAAGGRNRTLNGLVIRPASIVLKHPERWYYYQFQVSTENLNKVLDLFQYHANFKKTYNCLDILKYFNPFDSLRTQSPTSHSFICSGIVWYMLFHLNKAFQENHSATELPSPLRLSQWLSNWDFKPIPLTFSIQERNTL